MDVNKIGDYALCERLDVGGRVERHRAIDARSGQQVVVTLLPGRAEDHWPPWADPRIAQILDHPTIVRLLDIIETPEHVAFITELVDGVELRRLLLRGPVPIPPALTVAAEVSASCSTR